MSNNAMQPVGNENNNERTVDTSIPDTSIHVTQLQSSANLAIHSATAASDLPQSESKQLETSPENPETTAMKILLSMTLHLSKRLEKYQWPDRTKKDPDWVKIIQLLPINELRILLINLGYPYTEEICERLLTLDPSNTNLTTIIRECSTKEMREKAWRQLLQQNPSDKDLLYIVRFVSEKREEATELLLQRNPSNEILSCIILSSNTWKEEAGKQLLQKNPTNSELVKVITHVNKLAAEAWQLLLQKHPSNDDLLQIIYHCKEEVQIHAWEQLVKQNPTNAELSAVINNTTLVVQARKLLLQQNPSPEHLKKVQQSNVPFVMKLAIYIKILKRKFWFKKK